MVRSIAFLIVMAWAGAALAGDKVEFGPEPAWVKPVEASAGESKDDTAAVAILLVDQQAMLTPGAPARYNRSVIKIQTPQGLATGNISLPWRPEFDTLTVHKLLIHRGGQTIDVLASGQTFTTLRREANLESATLDGMLTANIQPEDLRVGDVLEVSSSVVSRDPTLQNHVEQYGGGWNGIPFARAHFSAVWPAHTPMRLRQTQGLPPIKPVKMGAMTGVELTVNDLQPLILPKRAPARFQLARIIELSDFQSWADLSALMMPPFEKAATIPADGALRTELNRIKAASSDPKARTEAALALVEDRVRYVALAMGTGNYVPADAAATWSRRFGDCKAKTVLLLALLRELDVPAEAVLVNAIFGDGIDQRLPMVSMFNHVVARATIGGKTYWLDGTRTGDRHLDQLDIPEFGWGLPLVPRATLVRIQPPALDTPTVATDVSIDSRGGLTLPVPIRVERVIKGDMAYVVDRNLANLSGPSRDAALRDYWKREYDYVEIKSATAFYDADKREHKLVMEGSAKLDWSGGVYWTDDTRVGFKADFARDPGPDKDAPFAISYPYYNHSSLKILLPPGVTADDAEISETVAGIEYRRHATLKDNIFTLERSERSLSPEFPASDAPAAQERLSALYKKSVALRAKGYLFNDQELTSALKIPALTPEALTARGDLMTRAGRFDEAMADFNRALSINPRYAGALAGRAQMNLQRYRMPEAKADIDQALKIDPNNGFALLGRSRMLMMDGRFKEALAEYDKAIAANPKNPTGYAQRALVQIALGDKDAATRDLDAATALDPREPATFQVRGILAIYRGANTEAIENFTDALEINSTDIGSLAERAEAYRLSGDRDKALADIYAAIGIAPLRPELYAAKASLLREQGKIDEAAAVAEELVAAVPRDGMAHVTAARIYESCGRQTDALRELDLAIAIKPEPFIYLNRAQVRPRSDIAGRRMDLDQALRLDPTASEALILMADFEEEVRNFDAATPIWSKLLASGFDPGFILARRGLNYLRLGNTDLGNKDLADARARAVDAARLNYLCYAKAVAGLALESALADCNAALLQQPDIPAILDSRGLVLLRLGRLDAAIADFNRVIAKLPSSANSLYGRAVAWARKGDKVRSGTDLAAAVKLDPKIVDTFRRYGVTL